MSDDHNHAVQLLLREIADNTRRTHREVRMICWIVAVIFLALLVRSCS